jgi:hypothetical protein
MKVLKLKANIMNPYSDNITFKAGRLFIQHGYDSVALATPTEPTYFLDKARLNKYITQDLFETVDLQYERWAHPHLLKSVRKTYELELVKES